MVSSSHIQISLKSKENEKYVEEDMLKISTQGISSVAVEENTQV